MKKDKKLEPVVSQEPRMVLFLTLEQADLVVKGLDVFSRLGIGQIEEILRVLDYRYAMPMALKDAIRHAANGIKAMLGHPANGSHGIRSPAVDDDFRRAFDILQVIRHHVAAHRNPVGVGVAHGTVYPTSAYPLPEAHLVVGESMELVPKYMLNWLAKIDEYAAKFSKHPIEWENHTSSMKDEARRNFFELLSNARVTLE